MAEARTSVTIEPAPVPSESASCGYRGPRESQLEIAGKGRLRFLEWGSPEASRRVLIFHGISQTADFAAPLAELLLRAGDWQVIAPDLRGHGSSSDFYGDPVEQTLIADALAMWSGAVGKPAIWCGSSLGARVAAFAAATQPEAVERLVLAEPVLASGRWLHHLVMQNRSVYRSLPSQFESVPEAAAFARSSGFSERTVELWLRHALRQKNDGTLELLFRPKFLDPVLWPPQLTAKLFEQLRALLTPTTILYGSADSALSLPRQEEVNAIFQRRRVLQVSGQGHDLLLNAPETLAEVITGDWVARDGG